MSIELCVLASGSGGNCSLVRTPAGAMLIDAGIGPRVTARRMNGTGVGLRDVRAICLTHLDRDHFTPNWTRTIVDRDLRVYCHESRVDELLLGCDDALARHVVGFDSPFEPLEGLALHPLVLAHDEHGSCGFVIEGFGCRVGYATDLGRAPAELIDRFTGLDVLALESNYDPQMQVDSGRPWFLKQRIMGGRGHLSNPQAFAAVRAILDRCEIEGARLPAHIVLLHRSRECNCPKLLRKLFSRDARIAGRLTLAEQFERSEWLRPSPLRPLVGEQLVLGWG
jgi:phosphoribosyl 1,2-cyclic phosphodiesterase